MSCSTPEKLKPSESFDFTNASYGTSELFIGISGLIGAGKVIFWVNYHVSNSYESKLY